MIPSLSKLRQWIPEDAARVQASFNLATADSTPLLARYRYGAYTIACSSVNIIGYTFYIPIRFLTAIYYVSFAEISQGCWLDFKEACKSASYSVGMTAFLFASLFSSRFSLKPASEPEKPVSISEPPITRTPSASRRSSRHISNMGRDTIKGKIGKNIDLPKDMKYRHIFYQFLTYLQTPEMCQLAGQITTENLLHNHYQTLTKLIRLPFTQEVSREESKEFVSALREAKKAAAENHLPLNDPAVQWIHKLALYRFEKIRLYDYCDELIRWASGKFETLLTLENFWPELLKRNKAIEELPSKEKMHPLMREWQKGQGHLNFKFDSGKGSNVPRTQGVILLKDRSIIMLQHGSPIKHSDPIGIPKRAISKLIRVFKPNSTWGASQIQTVAEDYIAFIEGAKQEDKNILHVIF